MAILFSNSVGPVPVSVIKSESHQSSIEITEIPIEDGSSVSDHAYRNPNRVTLEVVSEAAVATYAALKALQVSRQPFTLVTGLYVYSNMLIKTLSPKRDAEFSSVFRGEIELQEVILVGTSTISAFGASAAVSLVPSLVIGVANQRRATPTIARGDNRLDVVPLSDGSPEGEVNAELLAGIAR